jgi:hypothetical protein
MKCPRCGKDNPADIHTCSLPEALALASLFERYAIDHEPSGWPAIRQIELNYAAAELRRLHEENETFRTRYVTQTAYDTVKQIVADDTALLRQALEALERGETALRFAAIAALRERVNGKR